MRIKKVLILIVLISIENNIFSIEPAEKMIRNKSFSFDIQNINGSYGGYISFSDGIISANYGTDYLRLDVVNYSFEKKGVSIILVDANFNLYGMPTFRQYEFPKYKKIFISNEQIEKRIANKKFNIIKDNSVIVFRDTSAISICNNLRIRELPNTNSTTKVVGKLSKWQKVVLIDCTEEKTKIDNLEYPWYKIKLEDGTEGWVFGGFVKIYFDNEELEMLYKAFEKEGSEYTNQFITPDYS